MLLYSTWKVSEAVYFYWTPSLWNSKSLRPPCWKKTDAV